MTILKSLLLTAFAAAFAANAQAQGVACRAGQTAMLQAEMFFGRNIDGRFGVTERQWSQFLAGEITPRFPDGLTVIDGSGQSRDAARNAIEREKSKIVIVVTADDSQTYERIDAIVAAYKRRFAQRSVGVLTRPACAAF
jgi:hypothetical protein